MRNAGWVVVVASLVGLAGCGGDDDGVMGDGGVVDASAIDDLAEPDLSANPDLLNADLALSPNKALTAFSFAGPGVTATIDESAKTIAAAVPAATNVAALVATFTTTGASVEVGTTAQVSGTTINDFTAPVTYVVTATDASTASYVVTVSKIPSAPTLTLPVPFRGVVSPATIRGTSVAGATINVAVKNGGATIGTGTGTASGGGAFNFTVSFTEPATGTALTAEATATLGGLTSPVTTVSVIQTFVGTIQLFSGQTAGATTGTTVYFWILQAATDTVPFQSQAFTVVAGVNAPSNDFTFHLPVPVNPTTYYFLSFRDSNGDGKPSVGEPVSNAGAPFADVMSPGVNVPDTENMQ